MVGGATCVRIGIYEEGWVKWERQAVRELLLVAPIRVVWAGGLVWGQDGAVMVIEELAIGTEMPEMLGASKLGEI